MTDSCDVLILSSVTGDACFWLLFQLSSLSISSLTSVPIEAREHVKMLLNSEPAVRPDADQLSKVSMSCMFISTDVQSWLRDVRIHSSMFY